MSLLKKFFKKRKLDVTFKKAGSGHHLDKSIASAISGTGGSDRNMASTSGGQLADQAATLKAGEAALARLSHKTTEGGAVVVRPRISMEMDTERQKMKNLSLSREEKEKLRREVAVDASPVWTEILYCCPEIGGEVLPKEEMEASIRLFLYNSLTEDPEMSSAVMIHTLNKDRDKVRVCVDTLVIYLDNIIDNPGEEKYQKIRLANKAFQDRVHYLSGSEEFMQAAGFMLRSQPHEGEVEQLFWVMEEEMAVDTERLRSLKDVLLTAEPLRPQLDRGVKVFYPSPNAAKFNIPDSFFNLSKEELKREQMRKEEALEMLGVLRTKAMRERDELKELRRYRYTVLRCRFPDGVFLQGIFKANERFSAFRNFVYESLIHWLPFHLISSSGHKLTDESATMAELGLVPAAVVSFSWDGEVMSDVEKLTNKQSGYLKSELMARIQTLG